MLTVPPERAIILAMNKYDIITAVSYGACGLTLLGLAVYYAVVQNAVNAVVYGIFGALFTVLSARRFAAFKRGYDSRANARKKDVKEVKKEDKKEAKKEVKSGGGDDEFRNKSADR